MADLSLDDYIQKKNFRVQISNDNQNNNGGNFALNTRKNHVTMNRNQMNQNRGPSVTITGLGNIQHFDARQKLGPKITFDARERLQKKQPADARIKLSVQKGRGGQGRGGQGRGGQGHGQGFGNGVRQTITGPGFGQTFSDPGSLQPVYISPREAQPIYDVPEVRQPAYNMPGPRVPITAPGESLTMVTGLGNVRQIGPSGAAPSVSARLGNQGNDARSKIISLKKQKGTFDARSRIAKQQINQQQQHQQQQQPQQQMTTGFRSPMKRPGMNVVRNVNNPAQTTAQPVNRGSCIQLTTAGLQVTRAVPDATVSFEGSMLTVTKRRQDYQDFQQTQEATEGNTINYEYTADRDADYQYEEDNQLDLDDSTEFKPQLLQIKKTIQMSPVAAQSVPKTFIQPTGLKRKTPLSVPIESSGPLKLIKPTGRSHVPVITPPKRAKMAAPAPRPIVKQPKLHVIETFKEEMEEDEPPTQDFLSPLQGYRVYVTNLHPVVNQDDIIELFGAIGALRKAKLIKQGTAEVVYIKKEDAVKSVAKYHNRELDGLPMQVKVLTSTTAAIKNPIPHPEAPENEDNVKECKNTGPLKLLKQPSSTSSASSILQAQTDAESNVELPLVHKALFKLGPQGTSKPVTFTVKI